MVPAGKQEVFQTIRLENLSDGVASPFFQGCKIWIEMKIFHFVSLKDFLFSCRGRSAPGFLRG